MKLSRISVRRLPNTAPPCTTEVIGVTVHATMDQLSAAHLGVFSLILWTAMAALLAIVGGALAGMRLGGKDLGNGLAASMGAMFGPLAVVPGVLLGLVILKFL